MTNLLQIESDARCVEVIRRWIDSDEEHVWTALTNGSWRGALEALVAAELAPADWPERVDLWHKEVGPEIDLNDDRTYLPNVIDPRALPTILRNPQAVVTGETLLRGQIRYERDYAGIRSWQALVCGEASAWRRSSLRPSLIHVCGYETTRVFYPPNLESWFEGMYDETKLDQQSADIMLAMVDRMLSNAKPWALELARTGCGLAPYPPLLEDLYRLSFALVVRDGDGYPWPPYEF